MPWVRLDEKFAQHPKILQAGPLGLALHVAGLCYCNLHLTDGFISRHVAPLLLNFDGIGMNIHPLGGGFGSGHDATWENVVGALEEANLWQSVEGGWQIHDFLEYQPSKAHVLSVKQERQAAGAKGGMAKAKQNPSKLPANDLANAKQKSSPYPIPIPLPIEEQESKKSSFHSGNGSGNGTTTIQSSHERIARFQQKLAQALGPAGWETVIAACTRADPRHEASLALCKETARSLQKGWPRQWPIQ